MVRIEDEGVFDAPVDKVWKYLNDAPSHKHATIQEWKPLEQKGNVVVVQMTSIGLDKKPFKEKIRMTMNPPKGFESEVLEGPTKGSKFTHTYTAQGGKTHVKVTGDWKMAGLDDATIKKNVLSYFEVVFKEDNVALRTYK